MPRRVESFGGDGAIGEDRDDVIGYLDEAAVDVEAVCFVSGADAQLAITESADQRERPGAMPASPSKRGKATKSAGVSSAVVSGVTMMHFRMPAVLAYDVRARFACAAAKLLLLRFLPLGFGLFDDADVHEGVFGQVVPFAVADFFEAADRFGQRRDLARLAGEHFGDQERLRQEPLDAAGALHDELVLFGKFVDAEDRDDVLQFAVALQNRLHAAGTR